jgi:magnesium-transporting ATPase (P-type)
VKINSTHCPIYCSLSRIDRWKRLWPPSEEEGEVAFKRSEYIYWCLQYSVFGFIKYYLFFYFAMLKSAPNTTANVRHACVYMLLCTDILIVAMVTLLRDFRPYGIMITGICVLCIHHYNSCHGNAVTWTWTRFETSSTRGPNRLGFCSPCTWRWKQNQLPKRCGFNNV